MTDLIQPPITISDPVEATQQWFHLLGRYCAAVDYDSNEAIFAEDVVSFGTKAAIVSGREHLRKNQWEGIWGNIRDFKIDTDNIHAGGGAAHAWGVAPWSSTGFHKEGTPFVRPGRATVILERRDGVWLSVHTHFSLAPGTPAQTYGQGMCKPS